MWKARPSGARRPASQEAGFARGTAGGRGTEWQGTKTQRPVSALSWGEPRQRSASAGPGRAPGQGPGEARPGHTRLVCDTERERRGGPSAGRGGGKPLRRWVRSVPGSDATSHAAAAEAPGMRGADGPPDVGPDLLAVTPSFALCWPSGHSPGLRVQGCVGAQLGTFWVTVGVWINSFSASSAPEMGIIKRVTQGHRVI